MKRRRIEERGCDGTKVSQGREERAGKQQGIWNEMEKKEGMERWRGKR